MARVYLAYTPWGLDTLQRHKTDRAVNILISFAFWEAFIEIKDTINIGKLILDSGAFSVAHAGLTIDINKYIHVCKTSGALEVFALDDMLSWRKSQENTLRMWDAGVPAIPVYHMEEPINYLNWCCKYAPLGKIALSSRIKTRPNWLLQHFGHIWKNFGPMKIHGFGMASKTATTLVPFDSVDASSWGTASGRFGQFAGYTGTQVQLKSRMNKYRKLDLWVEVLEHMKREDYSEHVFRKELAKLTNRV